jgi:hypothetical protein
MNKNRMWFKLFHIFSILFYFVGHLISLFMGIYFIKHTDCTLEYDLTLWLIIASLLGLFFGLQIAGVKYYYPRFNFIHLRLDPKPLDNSDDLEEWLVETESPAHKYEKIAVLITAILYFFFLVWTIFGAILSQKGGCRIQALYDIVLYQLITNIIYLLFSFILILIKIITPVLGN